MDPNSSPDRPLAAPQASDGEWLVSLEIPPPAPQAPAVDEWPRYKRELDALLASLGP
ncbi:MAG TPA: hypothetical protein VMD49_07755 [Steroidobacteraceae bacterium]|nr:hypothetical protein [Steroidobacteraceae bacterium]